MQPCRHFHEAIARNSVPAARTSPRCTPLRNASGEGHWPWKVTPLPHNGFCSLLLALLPSRQLRERAVWGQFAGRASRLVGSSTLVQSLDLAHQLQALLSFLGALPAVEWSHPVLRTIIANFVPSTVIAWCISPLKALTRGCVYTFKTFSWNTSWMHLSSWERIREEPRQVLATLLKALASDALIQGSWVSYESPHRIKVRDLFSLVPWCNLVVFCQVGSLQCYCLL